MRDRMAPALLADADSEFSVSDAMAWFLVNSPDTPEPTVRAELIALTINHTSRHHYKTTVRDNVFSVIGRRRSARYRLYSGAAIPETIQTRHDQADDSDETISTDYDTRCYKPSSKRGTGKEKVLCVLLTEPEHILDPDENPVMAALEKEGLSTSIGLYFYRFKNPPNPSRFIKIGECTGPGGIASRFKRGWYGTKTYTDSYIWKKRGEDYIESDFVQAIKEVSKENPAYFVFYEHHTPDSHPKIDEAFAFVAHDHTFKQNTINNEKVNGNAAIIGRNIVWHTSAFDEVLGCIFPDGADYPSE